MTVPADAGKILLPLAREAIQTALLDQADPVIPDAPSWLQEEGASFVTLTENTNLRGCIGSLEEYRPLGRDVIENARAAAFQDPRFPAVTRAELPVIQIEVSVLSPRVTLQATTEAEVISQLKPQVSGVVLNAGYARATFLPQVWEQFPDPKEFLAHLKMKAGLPPSWWDARAQVQTYTVTAWSE